VVGLTVTLTSAGGLTVSVAVAEVPPEAAVIVAEAAVATAVVVIVNVPEVAPAATVTLAGGTALALLEDKVTTSPPVGAGPVKVTVPVEDVPPTTDVGETVRLVGTGGVIVSTFVTDVPPAVAVMVAAVEVPTGVVETVKFPPTVPAGTVVVAGTVALVLLDDRVTTNPPAGAGPVRETVPATDWPP
jgi:hypothetical protein